MARVLIIDDEDFVRDIIKEALAPQGHEFDLAASGTEAFEILRKKTIDLAIIDRNMPGMTGIDLAKEIRRRHVDLPVVLTSGYSHVLAENGSYGFELLQKPYSIDQLSRVLQTAARWRKVKRSAAE